MIRIGIVGCGNMGTAILSSLVGKYHLAVCEQDEKKAAALRRKFEVKNHGLASLVMISDILLLSVKPQNMDKVLEEMSAVVTKDKIIVSIAAGITTSFIENRLGNKCRVIRTMPNMPAQVGKGITAVCKGSHAQKTDVMLVNNIFNNVGETVVVKEELIDAVTAVSGSGPAYVFLFVELFIKSAQALGLDASLSKQLVQATLEGSASLLANEKKDAETLRKMVTSKGGTTEAALDVFMKNKIDKIFQKALTAAKKRSKELSRK